MAMLLFEFTATGFGTFFSTKIHRLAATVEVSCRPSSKGSRSLPSCGPTSCAPCAGIFSPTKMVKLKGGHWGLFPGLVDGHLGKG